MVSVEISVSMNELAAGSVRAVGEGEAKALFLRDATGVRAFQATCPHYGLPLDQALLCDGRLYCPFHKSAFDSKNGKLIEPPALHGLDQYPVRIEGGYAVATLHKLKRGTDSVGTLEPSAVNTSFVIVGTGAAASAAAITLRRRGFVGDIIMIGTEDRAPYDRPTLSKQFLAGKTKADDLLLDGADFYTHYGITRVMGHAQRIDVAARSVELADGERIRADALLIATGSQAIKPDLPGMGLKGVFTLRSLEDAESLAAAAAASQRAIVVGGGFIAFEASSFFRQRGLQVTVVSASPTPMAARLGQEVAGNLVQMLQQKGVRFVLGRKAIRLEGKNQVEAVSLDDGQRLEADLVLLAVGARPATEAIVGVAKRDDGSIATDERLAIGDSVYLAGDIAAYPDPFSGKTARIEHWRLAAQQGMRAALNMQGLTDRFGGVAYFWSSIAGKRLDFAGYAPTWDRIIMRGSPGEQDFICFYIEGERPIAACGIDRSLEMMAFMHLMEQRRLPTAAELDAGIELVPLLDRDPAVDDQRSGTTS